MKKTRLTCLLLLTFASLSLLSNTNLCAANVTSPADELHVDCCEKRRIETPAGDYFEERWTCFFMAESYSHVCHVMCDCGQRYYCGRATYIIYRCASGYVGQHIEACNEIEWKTHSQLGSNQNIAARQGYDMGCTGFDACYDYDTIQDQCQLLCPVDE